MPGYLEAVHSVRDKCEWGSPLRPRVLRCPRQASADGA